MRDDPVFPLIIFIIMMGVLLLAISYDTKQKVKCAELGGKMIVRTCYVRESLKVIPLK